MKKIIFLMGFLFLGATAAFAFTTANSVAWPDVPTAVQGTIRQNLQGGTVDAVERAVQDGQAAYKATVTGTDMVLSRLGGYIVVHL